jgi:hypothetical protein
MYYLPVKTLLILALAALPVLGEVKLTRHADRVDVDIDGKRFTTFYFGPGAPKPYLHPLRAPSGMIVTRQYPMTEVPGETRDHPHHRGLWFTHGDVNGVDFWANEPGQPGAPKGRVVFLKYSDYKDPRPGALWTEFAWQAPGGKPLLHESRMMDFWGDERVRIIDFDITLTARERVVFGDTKEGTFAIRLADAMNEKSGTGKMTNASGAAGMKNVWGKRSPWVDYSGTINGEKVGVAIFDHPANPRNPTYWHARDYGLFAANMFGEHDFLNDRKRDGSMTLKPGEKLHLRYRVIIHGGQTPIDKLYQDYLNLTKQP